MAGETDLARLLASLDVEQRPGRFTFVTGRWPGLSAEAHATIEEAEGTTYVVAVEDAVAAGAPIEYVAAWLTLTVNSSLAAVGLTAAVSRVLADAGISCNMLAGFHHDHLLVPADAAHESMRLVRELRGSNSR